MKKPLVLTIMDGFGFNENKVVNAIAAANTPHLDKIFDTCPTTSIGASGMDVGLPDGQMGNSEVGHTNMGAGRVVYQELTRITKSAKDGDMKQNEAFVAAIDNVKKNGSALHLMGLLSDGGVHSHTEHLYALVQMAKDAGFSTLANMILMGKVIKETGAVRFDNNKETLESFIPAKKAKLIDINCQALQAGYDF